MPKTPTPRVPTFPPKDCTEPSPSIVNASESADDLPHVATLEVADNAPSSVLERRVKLTDTAMVIAPETTYDEAIALYNFTHIVRERSRWWLADIVNWMEDHFPDKYTQAIDLTGLTYSRLTTICSVGRKIEPSRRRKEASFTWHERIAYLPYQTADHLLDRAIKEKWTNEQFEDSVARAKGEPTKAEKRAAKEANPTSKSIAKQVAASGKEPQVPEGEKPLIWNGHPLRVMVMPDATRVILQGDEALPLEEADRAAHQYCHAHGPALAAWLEEHNFIKGGDEPCAPQSPQKETSADATQIPSGKTSSATVPDVGASNGAAPNATESAPTLPIGEVILADPSVTKSNALETVKAIVEAQSATTPLPSVESLTATAASATLTPETFALLHAALETEMASKTKILIELEQARAQIATLTAPAAPPASPEPTVSADIAKTMQAVIDGLQLDVKKIRAEREEERGQMAETMEEMGAHPASHNTGEKAMMEVKNIWQSLRSERDDARDQLKRYDAHTAMQTPLQRAEDALLAFAAASQEVNWEEIGADFLLRQKWLERLLLPADQTIDRIQNTPLKARAGKEQG